ncbi:MAG: 5-(carboxyamino)imidazole ribonucleotide synthase [Pseudomonadota bacterium]
MIEPLPPGATIGILGGGQLGRMLALAAVRLGLRTHVFDASPNGPGAQVATNSTTAAYTDTAALKAFARTVDVVTYEFENIPTEALDVLDEILPIRPGRRALAVSQDRLTEKEFLKGIGLATAPYAAVTTPDDLARAAERTGLPAILKTRRFGYDGKGQIRLQKADSNVVERLNGAPAILEGFVKFQREVSVIAARGLDGATVAFDPGENVHRDGILHRTTVPAAMPRARVQDAVLIAARILEALDYVGVMGIELFEHQGGLIVNEIAPRVHNSGHWTQNGCVIDQFEQHIRAIAGWPLGDGRRHSDVVMENLIGADVDRVAELAQDGVALHLYGKTEARPGRKMGHVNRITGRT